MATDRTDLGDRIKMYESASTGRAVRRGVPMVVRLDGRAFHTFTRGLARPYDKRLVDLMRDTAGELVSQFHAKFAYTHSDEITLVWHIPEDGVSEYPFGGRFHKLESILAGWASAWFTRELPHRISERSNHLAVFDARAFTVPTLTEAYNTVLWRQIDCTKNATSMAAQHMFSHRLLHGKSGREMRAMLAASGVNFDDYPSFFTRGTFARRVTVPMHLTPQEISKIPADKVPTGPVYRSKIEYFDLPLRDTSDAFEQLFGVERC